MNPVIRLAELRLDAWQQGQDFESADASLNALTGMKGLGVSYSEVPPGKSGCPFHNHHVEEELFVILSGKGEYRYGERRHAVRAGDVLAAPAGGVDTAHQLINNGTLALKYLAISTRAAAEVIEYPDSGKLMIKSEQPEGGFTRLIRRSEESPDYWEDEPGA
ncbi:cupin domain-containing protein [Kushneria aurantia]|uniref:Cupin domain-containing protein n=1 Tax=Kushneria aurantia TaxID=504092 RepID=A0ABV6G649_9GAMM|nr:cupin domain-containing protein [Kushneria aurantia]